MFNIVVGRFEVIWIDDFYMNYGILLLSGEVLEDGFLVSGKYVVGVDFLDWGWRIEY